MTMMIKTVATPREVVTATLLGFNLTLLAIVGSLLATAINAEIPTLNEPTPTPYIR